MIATPHRALRLSTLVAMMTLPVAAQEPAAAPPATEPVVYAESLDVRLLELDVAVIDRSGAPIRGLSADDFEVRLDKKKIKPSFFSEKESSENLVLLLVADGNSLRGANLARTLADLRGDLAKVVAREDVAVRLVAYELDGAPDLYLDLRGVEDLEWAIDRLSRVQTRHDRRAGLDFGAQSTLEETLRQLRGNPRDRRLAIGTIDGLVGELGTRAAGQQEIAATSLGRLHALIRSLATTHGRKSIVLLTDGIPVHPLDSVLTTIQSVLTGNTSRDDDPVLTAEGQVSSSESQLSDGGLAERDPSQPLIRLQQSLEQHNSMAAMEALVADANVYRVTIMPVLGTPGDAAAADARAQSRGSESELTNMREPLNQLAERTGGIASTGGGALSELLTQTVELVAHSYSLGFEPPKDLTTAAVRISVKAKGSRVLAPSTVTMKAQRERLADRTMGGLALATDQNQHGLGLTIDAGQPESDATIPVQVTISFPIANIGLTDVGGSHRASAQATIAIVDSQMRLVAAQHVLVPLEIPEADLGDARTKDFGAFVQFRLPPGPHRVGLTLWDDVASRSSFISRSFTVGG